MIDARGRGGGPGAGEVPLPALDPRDDDVAGRHLLLLPPDVTAEEIEVLALSRFPRATWEAPSTAAPGRLGGARGRADAPPRVLRLSRHSTLHGPYRVTPDVADRLGVPASAGLACVLHAPVERGARPWGGGDRDGLNRAFPDGLPVRDEERSVRWLVDVARRLGGAVRTAARVGATDDGTPARPAVLVPDPASAVDLTVWTDIWLEPEATLAVVRRALPQARLNLPTGSWSGPPPTVGTQAAPGADALTPEQRRGVHEAADRHDMAALTTPPPMQAYGALADLELDGHVAVEVAGETTLPPVVAEIPWAQHGAVAYRVRWEPADLEDAEHERPSLEHRVARGRVTPRVVAVTRALHAAVGGEVTDAMDFVVDPGDL